MTAAAERETIGGLLVEFEEGVLRITIDRQERMNAIDLATMDALGDLLTGRAGDPSVRVVVIAGAGAAFSTGADLAAAAHGPEADPLVVMDSANRVIRAILTLPIPVIAEVNGPAAGVGASIAFAADLAFAAPGAYFLLAFVNVGLMPDGGSSLLVPAAIGRARASEMALLGRKLGAADAAAAGLIARVLPGDELPSHVRAVAARLARGPRRAIELTKRALTATTLARIDEAIERETEGQIELLAAPDFREGVAAMLGGRPPEFGR